MKKTVLSFSVNFRSDLLVAMPATIPFSDKLEGDKGAINGWTTMLLAGSLVFFGVRAYRENVCGGALTFAARVQGGNPHHSRL